MSATDASSDGGARDGGRLDGARLDAARGDSGPADACTPSPEICDGLDNDCDPLTIDGNTALGEECDGSDVDLCPEGVVTGCVDGALVCNDTTGDNAELCNGADDDCDPSTLDGVGDPMLDQACDSDTDTDLCPEGFFDCMGTSLMCSDATASQLESCNGADDDCDGAIDEAASCPCDRQTFGGHTYLFCAGATSTSWTAARDYCRARGYELMSADDLAEQQWMTIGARAVAAGEWWIGGNDRATEDTWVWVADGSAITYTNWESGAPNNLGGSQNCLELDTTENGATGEPGGWNDELCTTSHPFICEVGP